MLQALKILEGFGIADLDPEGAEFIHLVTETTKLVMADRDAWYGDDPGVPLVALLSPDYATHRRALIGSEASREQEGEMAWSTALADRVFPCRHPSVLAARRFHKGRFRLSAVPRVSG